MTHHVSVTVSEAASGAPKHVVSSQEEGATCADLLRATFGEELRLVPPSGSAAWCHVENAGVLVGRVWGYFGSLGDLTPAHLRAGAR